MPHGCLMPHALPPRLGLCQTTGFCARARAHRSSIAGWIKLKSIWQAISHCYFRIDGPWQWKEKVLFLLYLYLLKMKYSFIECLKEKLIWHTVWLLLYYSDLVYCFSAEKVIFCRKNFFMTREIHFSEGIDSCVLYTHRAFLSWSDIWFSLNRP